MDEKNGSHALLRGSDVFVEDLGALDADEVEAALFGDGRCQQGLSAARVAVEEQPAHSDTTQSD